MATNEELVDRVRRLLAADSIAVREQKMFGGLSFMLDDSFACGVKDSDLVVRVGPEREAEALRRPGTRPMDFTGRPLKGWLYVTAEALTDDSVLLEWVQMSVAYARTQPPSALRARKGSQAAAVHPRRRGRGHSSP